MVKRLGDLFELLHRPIEQGMGPRALCPGDQHYVHQRRGGGASRKLKHFTVQLALSLLSFLLGGEPRMEFGSLGLHGTPIFLVRMQMTCF